MKARRRKGAKGRRRLEEDTLTRNRIQMLWDQHRNYSEVARQMTELDRKKWSAQTVKNVVLRLISPK